ncbi:hypothetical protein OH492_16765 [Vibrio chagasii]|nr:hypothetical protein [Vibrio chagasii]
MLDESWVQSWETKSARIFVESAEGEREAAIKELCSRYSLAR